MIVLHISPTLDLLDAGIPEISKMLTKDLSCNAQESEEMAADRP